ncbi:amino acid adenylation domain-containing protein [candidate division KSB1 bacterium]|nr:amino acid adenylation domain-containing protein [candidate division KSB1 bacterium]
MAFPLSHPQKVIWQTEELAPDTLINIFSAVVRYDKRLDHDILQKAICHVVKTNQVMQLGFSRTETTIRQAPLAFEPHRHIYEIDFAPSKAKEQLLEFIEKQKKIPFELFGHPLFKIHIFTDHLNRSAFLIRMHHLIVDAHSGGLLLNRIKATYDRIVMQDVPECDYPSYREFVLREQNYFKTRRFTSDAQFWQQQYKQIANTHRLKVYDQSVSKAARSIVHHFDPMFLKKIKVFAQSHHLSVFQIFASSIFLYLSRATNTSKVIFGTPVHNRLNAREKNTLGLFISNLPFSIELDSSFTFLDLCRHSAKRQKEIYKHQRYPFGLIIAEYEDRFGYTPVLYDILFNMRFWKFADYRYEQQNLDFIPVPIILNLDNYYDDDDEFFFTVSYQKSHFNESEIMAMLRDICICIEQGVKHPSRSISDIAGNFNPKLSFLGMQPLANPLPENKNNLLFLFNKKKQSKSVCVFDGKETSYSELNDLANSIAHSIRKLELGKNDIIGLYLQPTEKMLASILGVLKAGAAFLPIDPRTPVGRMEYILKDASAKLLITDIKNESDLQINIVDISKKINPVSHEPEIMISQDDLAYVIYTSGSTGTPKGVLIDHRGIVNTVSWRIKEYDFKENDRILQLFSYSFDAFISTVFSGLASGATIVWPENGAEKDPLALVRLIRKYAITHLSIIPTAFGNVLDVMEKQDGITLKSVTVGGDKLSNDIISKCNMKCPHLMLVNEYGPTEASVCATFHKNVNHSDQISIGKPISNIGVYILNWMDSIQNSGFPGEICISGIGLARGYLNRPELTDEKFFVHPNFSLRFYRTGDLARYLPDGNIEYLGRMDDQLKIRGFRIELGEIETLLVQHKAIKNGVVLPLKNKQGETTLCAYYESDSKIDDLNAYFAKHLPEYMIPRYQVHVKKLPLTQSGKIDRNNLAKPTLLKMHQKRRPWNHTEKKLIDLWKQILGDDLDIDVNDHFFNLGGHSLKAGQLVALIRQEFHTEIPLKKIFDHPTVEKLAHCLVGSADVGHETHIPFDLTPIQPFYPLSLAQLRVFTQYQMDPHSTNYNIPALYQIRGNLDHERFEKVIKEIINRHEILRTSFHMEMFEPVQKVHPEMPFQLEIVELNKETIHADLKKFIQPFQLDSLPLFRMKLVKVSRQTDLYYLLLDFHHIIMDGISLKLFFQELEKSYNQIALAPIDYQYKDFVKWENKFVQSALMKTHEKFWIEQFDTNNLQFYLPAERSVKHALTKGKTIERTITTLYKDALEFAHEYKTTLYVILSAVFNILLHKFTGHRKILFGSPVAGRPHPILNGMIGVFNNTICLISLLDPEKTFKDYIFSVHESTLSFFEHQDYPFDLLVHKLGLKPNLPQTPIFNVMFSFIEKDLEHKKLGDLQLEHHSFDYTAVKYDLVFAAIEGQDQLSLVANFSQKYSQNYMETLLQCYSHILESVLENPEISINEIEMPVSVNHTANDETTNHQWINSAEDQFNELF